MLVLTESILCGLNTADSQAVSADERHRYDLDEILPLSKKAEQIGDYSEQVISSSLVFGHINLDYADYFHAMQSCQQIS